MNELEKSLKPCPFCGAKAQFCTYNYEYGTVTVGCTNEQCDITMGKGFFDNESAAKHWNRRSWKCEKNLKKLVYPD